MSFFEVTTKMIEKDNPHINSYSDPEKWIDTGSYVLNALVSGSIYGGMPNNKIVVAAGESSTGKTYVIMGIVSQFLKDNPDGGVFYFESEDAITKKMLHGRGIPEDRFISIPVTTVQEFRHQAIQILDKYIEVPVKERPPMLMCLDSLGMLSTTKEIEDTAEGKETADLTRARLIKATFRVLTLKLGRAGVPLLMTNHTYQTMGLFATKQMGGGSGIAYAADSVIFLSRRKEKDGTEIVGHVIHCKNVKSRLTKENKIVDVLLRYDTGLHRYYGLIDIAVAAGIFKKVSTKIEMPDGTTAFSKAIYKNPEKYFTKDILNQLDVICQKEFNYGSEMIEIEEELEDG